MSSKYHGQILRFPDDDDQLKSFTKQLPIREEFIDKDLAKKDRKRIAEGKYITVLPNDIAEAQTKELQKNGYNAMVSKLILYGILRSGEKVAVILDNISMFFDLMVPDNVDEEIFSDLIMDLLKTNSIFPKSIEIVHLKPFKEYLEKERPFLRIFFKTTTARVKGIRYFLDNEVNFVDTMGNDRTELLETYENDTSCHYRKVCRENQFTFGDWNTLEKYKVKKTSPLVDETKVSMIFKLDVKDFKDCSLKLKTKTESMLKDKTLISCWDLETFDPFPTGNAPAPEDVFDSSGKERSIIFMSAMTFGWSYMPNPLLKICISSLPVPATPNHLTIIVKNQIQLMKTKALIWSRMNPEFIYAFNDGYYDWPFIINRINEFDKKYKTNLMEFFKRHLSCVPYNESNAKWSIKGPHLEKNIKIEADLSVENLFFKAPGYISADVRTVFRQLYPKVGKTGSLNGFLKICKLPLKEDMPYRTMFQIETLFIYLCKIFKTHEFDEIKKNVKKLIKEHGEDMTPFEAIWQKYIKKDLEKANHVTKMFKITTWTFKFIMELIEQTVNVATYCVTDAERCQELMHKRNVVMDRRAIAKRAFVPMYDCIYRAGGMKVRNLVQAEGFKDKWKLAFNSISLETKDPRKYPGAYVVPPKKQLGRDHVIIKRYRREKTMNDEFVKTDFSHSGVGGNRIKIDPEEVDPKSKKFKKSLLKCAVKIHDYLEKTGTSTIAADENEKTDRPLTGLDFSSLYPNICITYNLSREKCIFTKKRMKEVLKKLKEKYPDKRDEELIHHVKFRYGLDGQKEEEKELIEGWFVRHIPVYTTDPETKKRTYTDYEGMGLYPSILLQLYKERQIVKKLQDYWAIPMEFMEKSLMKDNPDIFKSSQKEQRKIVKAFVEKNVNDRKADVEKVKGTRKQKYYEGRLWVANTVAEFFEKEYFTKEITLEKLQDNCIFFFQYYNANQLAIKVFMNTFYGEAGNSQSAFFEVRVAGGITTWGQYNIRMIKKFVEGHDYSVFYGDTDSLYITCPDKLFEEVDKLYLTGKIDKATYWTEMIEITMEAIDRFKGDVNNKLMLDNGTPFLTMAYEEVLWPWALTGKKKYGGVPHMGLVDLTPCMPECKLEEFIKAIFVRGWEFKKRGCSEFAVLNSGTVLKEAFSINCNKTLKEIVEDAIEGIVKTKWDPKVFIKTAKYKPPEKGKPGNVSVVSFMERMKEVETYHPEIGIKVKDPGERFDYVNVRRYPWSYDHMGRKQKIKQGDKYEYFESLTNEKYKDYIGEDLAIDIDYYMTGEIAGQYARYLVYHPDYDKFYKENMTDEEYKEADEKAVHYAKKMLTQYYNNRFKYVFEDRGAKYKALSKEVNKAIIEKKKEKYGNAATIFGLASSVLSKKDYNQSYAGVRNVLKQKIISEAQKVAKKGVQASVKKVIDAQMKNPGATVFRLNTLYVTSKNSLIKYKENYLKKMNATLNKQINELLEKYAESSKRENDNLKGTINKLRRKMESENTENENSTNTTPKSETQNVQELLSKSKINADDHLDEELVFKIYDTYSAFVALYRMQEENKEYKLEIDKRKKEKCGETVVPRSFDVDESNDRWLNFLDRKNKLKGEFNIFGEVEA